MKKAFLYIAAASALFAGCAKETDKKVDENTGKVYTITAVVDNEETRTFTYYDETSGKFQFEWVGGETIAVLPAETVNSPLPFAYAEGGNDVFTYTAAQGEQEYTSFNVAVSPYSAVVPGSTYDSYSLVLSGNYTQGESNAVMVAGTPSGSDGNYRFSFKHAAAIVKVSYSTIPDNAVALVFSTPDQAIVGDWAFDAQSTTPVTIVASGEVNADNNCARVTYDPDLSDTDFYLPIPTGQYQTFVVKLVDEDGETIPGSDKTFVASAPFTVNRAVVVRCPEITLPAPRGTVLLSEPFTGFSADDTPEAPGSGAIVYGDATVSYSCINGSTLTKIYEQALAGGPSPELLVSKANGEFAITGIPTGYHTSLTVSWNSNRTSLGLYYEGEKVTDELVDGTTNQYKATVTVPAGTASIDLSFKNISTGDNGRLDNILITAGITNAPAGLAYSVQEFETVLGDGFEEPELTNPHNLAVSYASSDPDVVEVNAAGEVTIKAVGTATITASSVATDEYEAGEVSYTITVVPANLTLSEATTPAKASCAADATVTFTVTSNVAWSAAKETDSDNIVKSVVSENNVVTVTFNKNEDAVEKTAVIAVTPTNNAHSALKKTITVTQEKFENKDVLTYTWTGVSGSGYKDWANKNGSVSSAVYAGNSNAGNITYIQLRNTSPSGIVSTTSGGVVRKVEIVWNGSTTDGRMITVYGSNNAYQGPSDLYDNTKLGTELGTIVKGTSTELVIDDDDYAYVGLLASAPVYADEIHITWGTADPNKPRFRAEISGDANIAADVTTGTVNVTGNVAWTASASNGATVSPASGNGEGTITVTMPENESFTESASYVVTVSTEAEVSTKTFNLTFTQDPAVDPNQPNGSLERPYRATDVLGITSATGVYVTGTISELGEFSDSYHNYSYTITDGTSSALVFRGKYLGGDDFTSADQLSVGDEVIVYGNIGQYQGVSQLNQNNYLYSLNGVTKLPTITKTDITGVSANGVTGATTSVTFADSDGWTPSVTPDGTIVTAASISGTTITYTVAKNTGSVRSGSIIVTLSRSGFSDVSATIDVSQDSSITPTYGTITITRSSFPAGALAYNVTDAWSVTASTGETITGEGDLYSTTNQTTMQSKNSGVSTMYHNTVATPGPITKITLTCASGTARTYTAYMNKTEVITSTSGGTNKGTIAPAVGQSKSLELSASDGWYYFWLNLAGGASYLDSIEIEYLVTD